MKLKKTFLRSKVAQRIFLLFVICALIPLASLAILGFIMVTEQVKSQSKLRLAEKCREWKDTIVIGLMLRKNEMKMFASNLKTSSISSRKALSQELSESLEDPFMAIVSISDKGEISPILGEIHDGAELTPEEKENILSSDKATILTKNSPGGFSRIFMGIAFEPENKKKEILLAEVDSRKLWFLSDMGDDDPLGAGAALYVLDHEYNLLYSSLPPPVSLPEEIMREEPSSGAFELLHDGEKYWAQYKSIFLPSRFESASWTVVLSEQKSFVYRDMRKDFKLVFIGVVLMSLWVVLLLSISQIRKSLIPIVKLKEGTQRIARREFDSRVEVARGDEFGELAVSFNTMAGQLGRQFKALTTMGEIDRAILSSLNTKEIADTVVTRMRELFSCNGVSVTVFDSDNGSTGKVYIGEGRFYKGRQMREIELQPQHKQILQDNQETLLLNPDKDPPPYLASLASLGSRSFLILPIFLKEELRGIVSLGFSNPPNLDQEDLDQSRQLANQVAVALSNAQLIEDLNKLNWGTLRALARAIDAKSPWTAGHSERGTQIALQIGKKLGLNKDEIDTLNRGALLHDIGKLGIGPEILDKEGKLTKKEIKLMNEHARLGATILSPIAAYADVIPIVLQHHENFDGTGYPDGLTGKNISLGARILAVADRYESLTADRPYRKALDQKIAVEYIKENEGSQLDPEVVQAFLEVMEQDK
jgi:putative nucleotidyltransferase with HDIG domain